MNIYQFSTRIVAILYIAAMQVAALSCITSCY